MPEYVVGQRVRVSEKATCDGFFKGCTQRGERCTVTHIAQDDDGGLYRYGVKFADGSCKGCEMYFKAIEPIPEEVNHD
jgi:hypothetical protein